jgi:hypothetical protein
VSAAAPVARLLDKAENSVVSLDMVAGPIDINPAKEGNHTFELARLKLLFEDLRQIFETRFFSFVDEAGSTTPGDDLACIFSKELQGSRREAAEGSELRG